ncbi:hypothetical protein COY87_01665 [Candidatus Roizmanbacteria bacterium CG_4_10_14_0_8_um_filter_33_9]|uniref:Uncharacterized protein n=2 Tax=Patescibacteria group TaxID=1783273 RepID=A0A2M7QIY9_9BACT|nr:MAG: hypothetical protein COY87_01665 [Candidatus Roizmanbacteria bacterium CG_4_10_14_0_8_um_filter_33_9]
MNSFEEETLQLLSDINQLKIAIDKEVDWFLAYTEEKDQNRKKLYESVYLSKQEAVSKLAKKFYDQYE